MVTLTAGETLQFSVNADSSALVVFSFAGPKKISITGTGINGTFSIAEDTANWPDGFYVFGVTSVLGGITKQIKRGTLRILPALSDIAPGADVRTTAAKAVANIEAMLSGSATLEARRYKINNRELERYGVAELLALLSFWQRKLASENRKNDGISALGQRIEVRV